jgi:hypothetical protein
MKANSFSRILIPIFLLIISYSCKKEQENIVTPGDEIVTHKAGGARSLPHTKKYSGEVATAWFNLLTDITKTKPYTPPPTLRIFAYSGMALYESVVPGMPSYQSMYKYLTGNTIEFGKKKDYYWPACTNAAIARIASRIMQNYPAQNLAPVQAPETAFNTSFQPYITPEQLQFSNEFGRYVADIIYDWSKTDGTLNPDGTLAVCSPYIPLGGPGNWVPAPPGFFPVAGACQGSLRTFIPNLVNTVLPPTHLAYSTVPGSDFHAAANEVYQISLNLTPDDIKLVNIWRDFVGTNYNPPSYVLKLATQIISKEKMNLETAAELLAKLSIASFDAVASAFHAKFRYALIRPITYIRNVMGYNSWNAVYPTPQHPSYPEELNPLASTVAILESAVGTNYAIIGRIHNSLYGNFTYPSLNTFLTDIAKARINGGVSFRFGTDAGIIQGRTVGQMINQLLFKKS